MLHFLLPGWPAGSAGSGSRYRPADAGISRGPDFEFSARYKKRYQTDDASRNEAASYQTGHT
jgi:hypothetical protein